MSNGLDHVFQLESYLFRRKMFKIFGGAFHVKDSSGETVMYSTQKAFKLREDMSIWASERKERELLKIRTPQILDWGATYFVTDSTTGEEVGAIARKGLKSVVRDEWKFLSAEQEEIGTLTESGWARAIISRLIKLVPQKYVIRSSDGREISTVKQHFNIFILKYTMDIHEPYPPIDRRLMIAMGILLCAIEGRQGEGGSYGSYGGDI
ncbi:hypothetical protein GF402_11380 [Candidatus Fermentibacteria bacterium]|nr:hypothetical protein [Candidatus Fermentibacteria bacterium]